MKRVIVTTILALMMVAGLWASPWASTTLTERQITELSGYTGEIGVSEPVEVKNEEAVVKFLDYDTKNYYVEFYEDFWVSFHYSLWKGVVAEKHTVTHNHKWYKNCLK